ncbi:MAG: glutamate--tRNA ligase [Patescibacteria group bacterium]|nr:glutamate--tRNA ligase [Patescibacteria group bacterium]
MVRVRFAPSPTGYVHIGSLRTALYNELFARHHGGSFILRIEDTDRNRYVPGSVENLLRTLEWAGLTVDEGPYLDKDGNIRQKGESGPYVQSERLGLYKEYAEKLLADGHAYRCFCSAETLESMKQAQAAAGRAIMYDKRCRAHEPSESTRRAEAGEPFVLRLKMPETGKTEFADAVRGQVSFENGLIDDQVLMKSDGYPTYHLANVIDDHLMGITHVIRAEEWLPSTPKHILLYRAFGWEPPVFAHLPLLLNADRSKLSKRQGDVAVEDYRRAGYLPEALVNFVALMGWNPSADREIYSKDELVAEFNLEKINKAGAVFNREKLDWFNREYIKSLSAERLLDVALPFFIEQGLLSRVGENLLAHPDGPDMTERLKRVLALERQRVDRLSQLAEGSGFYFAEDLPVDPAVIPWKKSTKEVAADRLSGLLELAERLPAETYADPKALEREFVGYVAEKGWTNADSLWPMRVALTGLAASPSPFEVAWAIGQVQTVKRLRKAITLLS